MRLHRFWPIISACAIVLAGCAPGTQPQSQTGARSGQDPAQPKRLVVGSVEQSTLLIDAVGDGNGDVIEELVSAGLVRFAPVGDAHPLMAEEVPSLDNNLVRVFPDGRMETTWRLKEGLKWQDGTPITTEDLLFAVRVGQDKELPQFGNAAYDSLGNVRAVDARTIVAEWKEPYIQYDRMFSWQVALPLPKHLLEDSYLNNKANFTLLRYWSSNEFVHAGPFRVRDFSPGERLVLEANPGYVLGRPKVDEVEVRFIPDSSTLIANVLGGEVHFTIGSDLTVGQAKQGGDAWSGGKLEVFPMQSLRAAVPQFINPDPPVQLDLRFRRALAHAIDRGSLNNLINQGLAQPPGNFMVPVGAPEYPIIQDSIVDYPYDLRRSAQLIEEIGYTKVGDFYRDAAGNELSIDFLEVQGGAEEQSALFVVDSWKRVGVNAKPDIRASAIERETRALRPGFTSSSGSFLLSEPRRLYQWFHGSQIPTAENRFRGNNRMRYANAEVDALIERFFATIPREPRLDLLKQIAHHYSDNAVLLVTHHIIYPALISDQVQGVTPRTGFSQTWENHLWDFR
jgi:peptide/nickel transport system substrate-binding protein